MIAKKSLSFFIEEELQESHGVILYPAWAGATSAAEPYVRHMPHVRRVPDLDLDLVLPLHCWKPHSFRVTSLVDESCTDSQLAPYTN